MYKTVRHGENSLQYTILPQTEEVLCNSGVRGKGRDYSPSIHVRRSRRKSTVKYIFLVIFGIIVALALASIPLYVMNGAFYARKNPQDYQDVLTAAPLTPTGRDIVKSRKKDITFIPTPEHAVSFIPTTKSKIAATTWSSTSSSTSSTVAPPKVSSERVTTAPWTMPALRSWKSSIPSTTIQPVPTEDDEEIPLVGTPSGSIQLLDHFTMKPWEKDIIISPTVTPEPLLRRKVLKFSSSLFSSSEKPVTFVANKILDDVLITTKASTTKTLITTESTTPSEKSDFKDLKDTLLSVDDDDDFKESLEVDEVFSLPPLKPDSGAPDSDSDEVTVSKTGNGWYGARWPFVDTSSYFQWTGYSPGDNLLLPLLVAALSSLALVLVLLLALVVTVKRRKRTNTAAAHLGKLTDQQVDDNTNLLTAENPDDADE